MKAHGETSLASIGGSAAPRSAGDRLEKDDPLEEISESAGVPIREVRFAVTMTGGTSLAIYENGVGQELFRLVHGQGIYGLLKRLTLSHAYIDVLSGASAGGINNVALSAALSVGSDFAPMREVWVREGGIDDLLQDAGNPHPKALLRGNDYYYPHLARVFGRLCDPSNRPSWSRPGVPSAAVGEGYTDLDLFVTGTFCHGFELAFFDARTRPIFTPNYAGVFHLKHRPHRQESHFAASMDEPFRVAAAAGDESRVDPGGATAPADSAEGDSPVPVAPGAPLPAADAGSPERRSGVAERAARIARSTSSIPVVFEPSGVDPNLMNGVIDLPIDDAVNYMLDGGLLNNRPVDLALEAIYRRPATREVLRKLLFVDPQPDPERLAFDAGTGLPSAVQAGAFAAQVGGYQTLARALDGLYEHNRRLRRVTEVLRGARGAIGRLTMERGELELFRRQQRVWNELRLQDLRDEIIALWAWRRGVEDLGAPNRLERPPGVQTRRAGAKGDPERAGRALRVLRSCLYELMTRRCRDLNASSAADDQTTPDSPSMGGASFSLDEIDVQFLKRKVARALDELYSLAYPDPDGTLCPRGTARSDGNQRRSRQQVRQAAYHALGGADHAYQLAIERLLVQLHRIGELVEIVEEHLLAVVAFVSDRSEFDAAMAAVSPEPGNSAGQASATDVADAAAQATAALWDALVAAATTLVGLTDGRPPIPDLSAAEGEWRAAARRFGELMKDRAGRIGARTQPAASAPGVPAPVASSASAGHGGQPGQPATIVAALNSQIDALLDDAATRWIPAAIADLTRSGGTAVDAPEEIPFSWWRASEPRNGERGAVPGISAEEAFRRLDILMYPIERAADLVSRRPIELVHISPRDVQTGFSEKDAPDKLAGDVLANFGGFLKRSWRVNDILWGRLDACAALAQILLDPDRLQRIFEPGAKPADPAARARRAEALLKSLEGFVLRGEVFDPAAASGTESPASPNALVPDGIGGCLAATWDSVRPVAQKWLERGELTGATPERTPALRALLDVIVRRHQLEILCEEVPAAVAAAVAEHGEWQGSGEAQQPQLRERPARTPGIARAAGGQAASVARLGGSNPDPPTQDAISAVAQQWSATLFASSSGRAASRSAPDVSASRVQSYFDDRYAIGSEDVANDIPPLVTAYRVSRALLVVLRLLDDSLPAGFKSSFAGKALSRYFLRPLSLLAAIVYGFLNALTQGSRAAVATQAAAWAVVVLGTAALVLGLSKAPALVGGAVMVALLLLGFVAWTRRELGFLAGLAGLLGGVLAVVAAFPVVLRSLSHIPAPGVWWAALALIGAALVIGRMAAWGWVRGGALAAGAAGAAAACYWLAPYLGWSDPLGALPPSLHAVVFWLALTATGCLGAALAARDRVLAGAGAPEGIVSFEVAETPSQSAAIIRYWRRRHITAEAWHGLGWDFLFIPLYTTTLGLACLWAAGELGRIMPPGSPWLQAGVLLALAQWVAGAFDVGENLSLLAALRRAGRPPWPEVAGVFSLAKFSLLLAGLLYILTGAGAWFTAWAGRLGES